MLLEDFLASTGVSRHIFAMCFSFFKKHPLFASTKDFWISQKICSHSETLPVALSVTQRLKKKSNHLQSLSEGMELSDVRSAGGC